MGVTHQVFESVSRYLSHTSGIVVRHQVFESGIRYLSETSGI